MIKNRIIIFLGVAVAIIPFTGFPSFWRDIGVIAFGFVISTLSFLVIRDAVQDYNKGRVRDISEPVPTFVKSPISSMGVATETVSNNS